MSNDEFLKRLLEESEIPANDKAAKMILGQVLDHSTSLSQIEPPAGYEAHLLASLSAKLATQKTNSKTKNRSGSQSTNSLSGFFDSMFSFLKAPQLSWSLTGGLTMVIALLIWFRTAPTIVNTVPVESDLMTQAASKAGPEAAAEWLASVGDSGIRAKAGRGLSSLADELANSSQAVVDKALSDVAKSMGRM